MNGLMNGKQHKLLSLALCEMLIVSSILILVLCPVGDGVAGTLAIDVAGDTYVDEAHPDENFGFESVWFTGPQGSQGSNKDLIAYLHFDVSSHVPEGSTVSDVELRVPCYLDKGSMVYVHEALSYFSESLITWNNKPLWDMTVLSSRTNGGDNTWWSFTGSNLMNVVQNWVNDYGNTYETFALLSDLNQGTSNDYNAFLSREIGYPAELSISYMPPISDPPIAYIDSLSPNPATEGETVWFYGHGEDPDGWIIGQQWRSSLDGFLSTAEDFSTSSLSVGEHAIYYMVKDNDNLWSSEASRGLTVNELTTNNPPYKPHGALPDDGATGIDINANLYWSGGDPDPGDAVTYDVYFEAGDTSPDILVSDDQVENSYDPGTLSYGTTYYWKIVAEDTHGAQTGGGIWDFTTGSVQITDPIPMIVEVDYDSDIDLSQSMTIDIYGKNAGDLAEEGYFQISFPSNPTEGYLSLVTHDFDSGMAGPHWKGEQVTGCYGTCTVTLEHSMVEGGDVPWAGGKVHHIQVQFTPSALGVLEFYVKLNLRDSAGDFHHDPPAGRLDQQYEHVRVFTVSVNDPPKAHIDSIAPNPAIQGETVWFSGHGEDSDGTTTAYEWHSTIDGTLSYSKDFASSSLSVGIHAISFRVMDNDLAWSHGVGTTLVIEELDPSITFLSLNRIPQVVSVSAFKREGYVVSPLWIAGGQEDFYTDGAYLFAEVTNPTDDDLKLWARVSKAISPSGQVFELTEYDTKFYLDSGERRIFYVSAYANPSEPGIWENHLQLYEKTGLLSWTLVDEKSTTFQLIEDSVPTYTGPNDVGGLRYFDFSIPEFVQDYFVALALLDTIAMSFGKIPGALTGSSLYQYYQIKEEASEAAWRTAVANAVATDNGDGTLSVTVYCRNTITSISGALSGIRYDRLMLSLLVPGEIIMTDTGGADHVFYDVDDDEGKKVTQVTWIRDSIDQRLKPALPPQFTFTLKIEQPAENLMIKGLLSLMLGPFKNYDPNVIGGPLYSLWAGAVRRYDIWNANPSAVNWHIIGMSGFDVTLPGEGASYLAVSAHSPVNLKVTDERGFTVGYDPTTSEPRVEVEGAVYSGPNSDPELIYIPNATGRYRIEIIGVDSGSYAVRIDRMKKGVLETTWINGTISTGIDITYDVSFESEESSSGLFSGVAAVLITAFIAGTILYLHRRRKKRRRIPP